ncbi:MAG: patatin family protein [Ectobacillus sp.]
MKNIGLVLEGGGMRGLYTAGVLEYFMEKDMFFPYVIGVSAGACMAASYLSRQQGRNKRVNIELANDPRYLSFRNLLWKRQLFGMDFLFDEIPNKVIPFDFHTFLENGEQFVIGTTDCETGEAVYYNKHEHGNDILTIIRASSSLPFIAPLVEYDGRRLLDGALIDPIPIKKAQADGFQKNIVIMTKPIGYSKHSNSLFAAAKLLYRRYPKIAELLQEQYVLYNNTISFLHAPHQKKRTYVIQPSIDMPVSRIERNTKRLVDLYELGYNDAHKHYESLQHWINE